MAEKKYNRKGTKTSSFGTSGRINHDSSEFYNSNLYKNNETEVSGGVIGPLCGTPCGAGASNRTFGGTTIILSLTANDTLRVQGKRPTGSTTVTVNSGSTFTVTK